MAQVDPLFDFIDWFRQGGKWTNSDGVLTEEAINQLENLTNATTQVINRTGGSVDIIQEITNTESFDTSGSSTEYHEHDVENEQIEDLIFIPEPPDLIEPDYNPVFEFKSDVVTSSTIAVNRDWKDVRSGSTVTLDTNASENDLIRTSIGDSSGVQVTSTIELRYAGKRGSCFNFSREGTSVDWCLFVNGSERFWRGV